MGYYKPGRKPQSLNGKPIRDAEENLDLSVTSRDVNKSNKRDPMFCAVARGICKQKRVISVRVGYEIALVEFPDEVVRYQVPKEVSKKVRAFDAANYFEPGKYTLAAPTTNKLGVHTKSHMKKVDKDKKRIRKKSESGKHVKRKQPIRHIWHESLNA